MYHIHYMNSLVEELKSPMKSRGYSLGVGTTLKEEVPDHGNVRTLCRVHC